MAWPFRITDPLLDVVDVFLDAEGELHGWEIMKRTARSGPTVYQVLERLRKAEWLESRWEELPDLPEFDDVDSTEEPKARRRRRYYRMTGKGAAGAPVLLAERRRGRRLRDFLPDARPGLQGGAA